MGLKDWSKRRGMKQPVPGTFSVKDGYLKGDHYRLTGVLAGQGVPPHPAEVKISNVHDRWHHAATTELPTLIDATNPSNFTILWDDVPQLTQQQVARRFAEQAAAAASGQAVPQAPMAGLTGPEQMGLNVAMQQFGQPGGFGGLFGGAVQPGNPAQPGGMQPGVQTHVTSSVTVNGVPVDPATAGAEVSAMLQSFGLGSMFGGAGSPTGAAGPLPEAALRQGAGEPATAVVLSAHAVPEDQWPAGPRPPAGYLTYALDVTGADGSTWSATALQGFNTPQRRDATSTAGHSLPVRYDPASRSRVAIDLTRLPPLD